MASLSTIRRWFRLAPLAVLAIAAAPARAAHWLASPDCGVSTDSLNCRLAGVLSFLYVAAALLAFVLLLVIVLAVRSFRRRANDDKGLR
jgi:hypothetical protein